MKKANKKLVKDALICTAAGIAAVMLAREFPAMIRYYRMKRL